VSQGLTFVGKFGRTEVDYRNGLWRVVWDGQNDWYADKDDATKVAIGLAHNGRAPDNIISLLDRSVQQRRMQ
jgi:hypothetical protein